MHPIDIIERRRLRNAVIAYMKGTIRTNAFDDMNSEFMGSPDESLRRISGLLYQIHDDMVDHPISVSESTWETMLRIIAFLDTHLEAAERVDHEYWPFKDETHRDNHCENIVMIDLPSYKPQVHDLPIHSPFNRIPAIVGFGLMALATFLMAAILCGRK